MVVVVAENPVKSVTDIFVPFSCFFAFKEGRRKFLSYLRYTRSGPDGLVGECSHYVKAQEKRPMGPIGILSRDRQTDDS